MATKCYLCGLRVESPCRTFEESEACNALDAILTSEGELIEAATTITSDGGSSGYYKLPRDAEDLQDLIEERNMSFARGNLFKALYRFGEKAGVDHQYDLNKMQWFLDRLKKMYAEGRPL